MKTVLIVDDDTVITATEFPDTVHHIHAATYIRAPDIPFFFGSRKGRKGQKSKHWES
jgi:hypothetical protein